MESKLKNKLDGLEFKPGETLWDKIQNNLQGDFERSLSNKLEKVEFAPSEKIWENISDSIESKDNKNRFLPLTFLLVILLASITWGAYFISTIKNNEILSQAESTSKTVPVGASKNTAITSSKKSTVGTSKTNSLAAVNSTKNTSEKLESESLSNEEITPIVLTANKKISLSKKPVYVTKSLATVASSDRNIPTNTSNTSENITAKNTDEPTNTRIEEVPAEPKQNFSSPEIKDSTKNEVVKKSPLLPDSISNIRSITSIVNASNSEALSNFSIEALVSLNNCFMLLKAPTSGSRNISENLAMRKSVEKNTLDWSGQFRVSYRLGKHFKISSGVGMLNFSQEFYYNTTKPQGAPNAAESGAKYNNVGDSIIGGSQFKTQIHYSWTEIPLNLAYTASLKGRFSYEIEGGVSYAFLSSSDAGMINYDNVGVLIITDKESFPKFVNTFFVTISPAILFKINNTVDLGAHLQFKNSLGNMVADPTWIRQYPGFYGAALSIRKRI